MRLPELSHLPSWDCDTVAEWMEMSSPRRVECMSNARAPVFRLDGLTPFFHSSCVHVQW